MTGALINHLWQSTLSAIAAGLLTLAFRRNHAQVRYWLWFSASLKFFVPFSLLMSLGGQVNWPHMRQVASPAISLMVEQIALPFADAPTPATSAGVAVTSWTPLVLFAVWLIGFVLLAWSRLRIWHAIRAIVTASTPASIAEAGIPASVQVRSTAGLLEPGVVGWMQPVLLLPSDILERLTPRQLNAILAHELCHVRRRDNLTSAIHMIVEAVFWFHPLVWWIGARLVDERERACDEEVLRLGNEPQDYSEGILNVCKVYLTSPLRCVSGVTGPHLKKRIRTILSGRPAVNLSFAKKTALAALGTVILTTPIVAGAFGSAAMRRSQSPAPEAAEKLAARDALNKGIRAFRNDKYDEAIEFFNTAIERDPSFQNANLYLATTYTQQFKPGDSSEENKKYKEMAVQTFSKVLQKDPEDVTAINGLAAIYLKDHQLLKARELYFHALGLKPNNAVSHSGIGSVDLAISTDTGGDFSKSDKVTLIEEGMRHLESAVALNPDYDQAMETMSRLYLQKAAFAESESDRRKLEEEASLWRSKSLTTHEKNAK